MLPIEFFDDSFNLARAIDRDAYEKSITFIQSGPTDLALERAKNFVDELRRQQKNFNSVFDMIGTAYVDGKPVTIYRKL